MAHESFTTLETSDAVAEVVRHGMESAASMKPDGGALFTISQALCGLVGSSINSLEEFHNVGNALELEIAAGIVDDGPDVLQTGVSVEAKPELLVVVAGALKEMVGKLVSDMKASIKANAEVQKLLPAMLKCSGADHHAFFQELMISKQPSCLVDVSPSSIDSRMVKRAARKGEVMCKHVCEHHPEIVVVDRWLWRKLPLELVELVFAKLPLPLIIQLRKSSGVWNAMSKSSNFGEACSEKHPQLFGLMGWDGPYGYNDRIYTTVHDIKAKEGVFVQLASLPETLPGYCDRDQMGDEFWVRDYRSDGYRNSMYACDGGLVCFVPNNSYTGHNPFRRLKSCPILVCNPLTSVWKTHPLIPLDDLENTEVIMVQLVVEEDTKYNKWSW